MDKAIELIELIVSWIQKNLKNPKLYVGFVALVFIVALVFPYIDANFFFYNRIEKRIDILQSLTQIDLEKISESEVLQKEYDSILSDLDNQREWVFSGASALNRESEKNNSIYKFLSGSALSWIIALLVPFMDTFDDRKSKFLAFFLLALFGGILGLIGSIIPTIFDPWVNYVGFPVLQLIVLIALAIKPKQEQNTAC